MNKTKNKFLELLWLLKQFFTRDIWVLDFSNISKMRAFFYQQILVIFLVGRAFFQDRLLVRASALVYATLLSIVPLLAVMFSLLKGFGFHNKLDPALRQLFAPLGSEAIDSLVPAIVTFVNNVKVGALGAVGLFLLFLSVLSIVNNIERAFNDVWKIRKVRSIHRRFTDYLSILILGPVLVFTFLGLTASVQSLVIVQAISKIPGIPFLYNKTVPLLITWAFFYFILSYVPNTKVKFSSALPGAAIAGTMWLVSNYFFAHFIVSSYQYGAKAALYAGFATFPLFLVWMFLSWAIILLGVELSYVYQNIDKIAWEIRDTNFSYSLRMMMGLKIMLLVSNRYYAGEKPPTADEMADIFNSPEPLVHDLISVLAEGQLLLVVDTDPLSFVPGRRLENISINDIIKNIRFYGADHLQKTEETVFTPVAEKLMSDFDGILEGHFGKKTLLDMVVKK